MECIVCFILFLFAIAAAAAVCARCCYGTTIESFAKLGDSVYFQLKTSNKVPAPVLVVSQFIPSNLDWRAGGIKLRQTTAMAVSATGTATLTVTITVTDVANGQASVGTRTGTRTGAGVKLRVPSWAVKGHSHVHVNGAAVARAGPGSIVPGSFANVQPRAWKPGDNITMVLGMEPRLDTINDARSEFASVGSIMLGPYVMAGV